ncbi:hypothetical protein MLD38_005075 [Melastoma candidum]|uniref:Uncharacterized protein n=1 Tax=Melastoma candidum TaxID=119954 RepID=A0ACB9S8J9_9MYRT|nr:hypothetical protein MLD38_005075 [Melastoma candidum]
MHSQQKPRHSLLLVLSLPTFVSLFLILKTLDLTRTPSISSSLSSSSSSSCNYSVVSWVYDPGFDALGYDDSCKGIFEGWNCITSGKSNARDLVKWRVVLTAATSCRLMHPFSLKVYRDTSIGADRGFTFIKYNLTVAYQRTNLSAQYDICL